MKNVAVFGAGRIGRIHAANLAALPGVTLKYVCDPVGENAAQLAAQLGARVATPEAVFADPDIDVIAVASPTDTHSDLIGRAAAARKHIFCEKPIDLSVSRAEACAQAVKDAGIACMIGFQRRFDPTFNEARERLVRGEIGVPEMLVVTSRDPGAPPAQYLKGSGGIFRDMLIHDFDVFRWILCGDGDEADTLYATGSVLIDPEIAKVPDIDCSVVTIRTRRGRLAQINTSRRAAYGYDQRFEVLGSAGMLQCGNHRPSEVVQSDAQGVRADKPEHFFLQRYREAYRLEVTHFFDCLQSGQPFRTTIEDGVAAQKLADAAARSLESGQVVTL
ncbi:inositol 2-dehydrogenase [Rhizobacter sp. Root1221]|uniref:inositol 2-dehydrogenase n=1 Tax=Rhizobacter sp. Root1221 TaxID=1736433 RepID=UPI0006FFB056|nr:inositol 2-dehydrogenase [Rhizobacter sp. Root1221]KQV99395.1 inositol 2-dehydrogenase [Rhizobacter sp. Root1221]